MYIVQASELRCCDFVYFVLYILHLLCVLYFVFCIFCNNLCTIIHASEMQGSMATSSCVLLVTQIRLTDNQQPLLHSCIWHFSYCILYWLVGCLVGWLVGGMVVFARAVLLLLSSLVSHIPGSHSISPQCLTKNPFCAILPPLTLAWYSSSLDWQLVCWRGLVGKLPDDEEIPTNPLFLSLHNQFAKFNFTNK